MIRGAICSQRFSILSTRALGTPHKISVPLRVSPCTSFAMRRYLPRATLLQVFSLVTLLGMVLLVLSMAQMVGGGIEIVAEARARDELSDQIRTRNPFWL